MVIGEGCLKQNGQIYQSNTVATNSRSHLHSSIEGDSKEPNDTKGVAGFDFLLLCLHRVEVEAPEPKGKVLRHTARQQQYRNDVQKHINFAHDRLRNNNNNYKINKNVLSSIGCRQVSQAASVRLL